MATEHLGRWLASRALEPSALSISLIEGFQNNHLPHCRCVTPVTHNQLVVSAALHHFHRFFHRRLPCRCLADTRGSEIERAIRHFDIFEQNVLGLASATRLRRAIRARTPPEHYARWPCRARLTGESVASYVMRRAQTLNVAAQSEPYRSGSRLPAFSACQKVLPPRASRQRSTPFRFCSCTISRNGPARFRINGPTLHGLPAEPRFESSTRPFSLRQVFWL